MIANSADMLGLLTTARPPCATIARRGDAAISFGEFLLRVGAWQHLLRPLDGRAFALFEEDSVEFAAALYGGWFAGKVIYLPGDNLPGTCAALSSVVDGFLGEFDCRWSPLAAPHDARENSPFECRRLEDDFAGLVLYTSGTTGAAQAIGKNLGQLAREVATLEEQFGGSLERAEIVSTVSHQHIYGLLFRVLWPLAAGRVFHARSFTYFEDLAPVLAARDCALVASPAHLKRLPPQSSWSARGRVNTVFSSGGPLAFEAAQEASALLGTLPIEVYGSSETGGIAWRRQSSPDEAWLPFPRIDWRVAAEEGVLELRSPNLPDERWFRTADRVEIAPGGKFFLRGRIDRIAKVEGKRVSLSAVERQLTTSSLVAEARVALLDGRRQRVAAFVVLSADGRRELAEAGKHSLNRLLVQTLSAHVEPVAIPRLWRYLDCLPINAQGKTTIADLTALTALMAREKTRPRERLIEQSAERALFELVAPADLIYFDGHFRDAPLLPGVVQIDWVIEYGRRCFDLPAAFRGVHALKFHRLIKPEMVLTLELIFEPAKSALSFKIASAAGTHASGRILFGPEMFKLCAVIPVYNHENAITDVVAAVSAHAPLCILVDDGSSVPCAQVLDRIAAAQPDEIILLRHAINRGKGGAVMTGMRHAARLGFSHALQIDADGQHQASDVPRFIEQARLHPDAVIVGWPEYDTSVPWPRYWARYLTHAWVWINTMSLQIKDSMCGFRVYPLRALLELDRRCKLGQRMNFDIEVLVRLYWQGIDVINVSTVVSYPKEGRSHFRGWLDNFLISRLHATLFFGMLWRLPMLITRKWSLR